MRDEAETVGEKGAHHQTHALFAGIRGGASLNVVTVGARQSGSCGITYCAWLPIILSANAIYVRSGKPEALK